MTTNDTATTIQEALPSTLPVDAVYDAPMSPNTGAPMDLACAAGRVASWSYRSDYGKLEHFAGFEAAFGEDADVIADAVTNLIPTFGDSAADVELEIEVEGTSGPLRLLVHARGHRPDPYGPIEWLGAAVDTTGSYNAQQSLEDLVERYRLLVELSPDLIGVHEAGKVVYVNQTACRVAKASSPADLIGRSILELLDASSLGAALERLQKLDHTGAYTDAVEATLIVLDGGKVPVEVTSVRTTWEGRPAYQVIMRDISERKSAEAALRHQGQLIEQVMEAIISCGADRTVQSWNPAAERIFSIPASRAMGHRLDELCPDLPVLAEGETGDEATLSEQVEGVHVRPDGTRVVLRLSTTPVRDAEGRLESTITVCSDITEHRRVEERYRAVVSALSEGVIVVSRDGHIRAANDAASTLLGVPTLVGQPLVDVWAAFDPSRTPIDPYTHPALRAATSGTPQRMPILGVRAGGTIRWLSVTARPLDGFADDAAVCSFADITDRINAERTLAYAATHDSLTGLPNRKMIRDSLDEALTSIRDTDERVAVLFVDLDRFKMVNDHLGHDGGDAILCEVARRLERAVRTNDIVGRLGGDEFVVVASGLRGVEDARTVADAIFKELAEPITAPRNMMVSASIGIALADGQTTGAADLLRDADIAMYQAKQQGRNQVEVFATELRDAAMVRLEIREDLRAAIDNVDLEVFYQPVYFCDPLSASLSVTPVGVEALVRWPNAPQGPMSPADFIPLAEESGLVVPLGAWVLETACKQIQSWRTENPRLAELYVAVNLSPRQLSHIDILDTVTGALERSGLPPHALWLEVTETALSAGESEHSALETLNALRALGVHLSLDDFGTGYSSLSRLAEFPFELLKIDRSFVDKIASHEGGAIVEGIIHLTRGLSLAAVAEGVETVDQLERLRKHGCGYMQGFLLARPQPHPAALETLLAVDLDI